MVRFAWISDAKSYAQTRSNEIVYVPTGSIMNPSYKMVSSAMALDIIIVSSRTLTCTVVRICHRSVQDGL